MPKQVATVPAQPRVVNESPPQAGFSICAAGCFAHSVWNIHWLVNPRTMNSHLIITGQARMRTGIIKLSHDDNFLVQNAISDKTGALSMEIMDLCDTSDAVSSMRALRIALTEDLDDIEMRIHELAQSPFASSESGMNDMQVYYVARAALYSGLASINEVLSWVRLIAAKDAEGNVAEVVKSIPTVPLFSIH
jgi:hypothetical protein